MAIDLNVLETTYLRNYKKLETIKQQNVETSKN